MSRIDDDIKKGTFSHCYLLYGPEAYLRDNDCVKIRRVLTSEEDTMNWSRYEGKDLPIREVISQAETMPFFAERRLIEIRGSGLFKGAKETSDTKALLELLKNPPETTFFVFCEEQVDARGKLFKTVRESGAVIEYKPLTADRLEMWVAGWLKKRERMITGSAVSELISRTGTDMYLLTTEMKKLISYTEGREGITKADVEALCTSRPEDQIFKMISAISAKDRKRAMDLYGQLLAMNADPIRILALIAREYTLLWQVKDQLEQGFGRDAIAEKVKIRPYFMKQYLSAASLYSGEDLVRILNKCGDTDEAIKTGQMKPQMAVEMLIMEASASE